MVRPITMTINGLRIPAVSHGCVPFPAIGQYPATWRLHLLSVLDGATRHVHAGGVHACYLNAYAAAAMERGADVFAWCDDPTDAPVAVTTSERVA